MKKLAKKQTGGSSSGDLKDKVREATAAKRKKTSDSTYTAMMKEVPKVTAPRGADTARVGSVKITVAQKKMGGQTKKKK